MADKRTHRLAPRHQRTGLAVHGSYVRGLGGIAAVILLAASCALLSCAPAAVKAPDPGHAVWNTAELFKPPAYEWIDRTSPIRSLFYKGARYHDRDTRVFAYYATPGSLAGDPSLDRKLPCVVLVHGGGGHAFSEWVEMWAKRGYAAIAMDHVGCGPGGSKLHDGGPGQDNDAVFFNVDGPPGDMWTHQAVSAVILAHSLVRSFPEIDPSRTAITGISWGGYLTCIVAGLDHRFRAAAPIYGCGFLADDSAWIALLSGMSESRRTAWTRLFDPSRYVGSATMPMFFVNGTNDFAYPLDSYTRTYDLVKSPKNIRITVKMPHSHTDGWAPSEIGMFIDSRLRGGAPLPKVETPRIEGRRITAKVAARTRITEAHYHFTTDTGPINACTWLTRPADIDKDMIATDAPSPGTTIWFLTVRDERGAVMSSEPVIQK